MQNKALWIVLGLIGLGLVGYLVFAVNDEQIQPTTPTPISQPFPTTQQEEPTESVMDENQEGTTTVLMVNTNFQPANVTIQEGETITWENEDSVLHTVNIEELNIDEEVDPGDSFSYTFDEAGRYDLNCTIHAGMDGTITVESASTMEVETDTSTETDTNTNLDTNLDPGTGLY